MSRRFGAALLLGSLALTACGSSTAAPDDDEAALSVVASFYPLEWLAGRLLGDDVVVTGLTPPGTEPHDLVLDPRSREAIDDADVVLYLGLSYQPDVERAVAQLPEDVRSVDALTAPGVDLLPAPGDLGKEPLDGNLDPHVWLDPVRMSVLAEQAAEALVGARPALRATVTERLGELQGDLTALDEQLRASLATCERRTIVTSHAAFGYLADRYDLDQIAIAGLDPDDEPDPATLSEIATDARDAGVTTVFFEEALPPDLARTVADEIGAETDLLGALEFDPAAAVGSGEDYLSVMQQNGRALATGLGCSS